MFLKKSLDGIAEKIHGITSKGFHGEFTEEIFEGNAKTIFGEEVEATGGISHIIFG